MLRFKRDDGTSYPEWKEKKLDDIGEIITGNTPSTQDSENYGNEFMFCSPADMGDNKYILKTGKMLSQKGFDISRKLPGGSVLVTCIGSTIGKIGIASKEMTSNQQINSIIAYDSINNEFIYYSLLKNFKKYLNLVSSQAVPILNKSQFEKLVISVPHIEEQQKIADFLSEVDNIITASEQEIESLEMQKKGAMQKIFSQEVRFKADDGSEYPAWEEKKMDNICSFFSGGTPTSSNADYYGGEIPFIRSGEIHLTSTELFITDIGLKASSAKMVNIGDILYALYGATSGEVDISKINGAINQAILCIRPDKYQSSIFIKELLNHNKDKIVKTFLQGGQGNLSAYTIKNLKYEFPCFEEQQKIADFLSEFDNAIEYAKEELEIWQNIKKGLLQQMFE